MAETNVVSVTFLFTVKNSEPVKHGHPINTARFLWPVGEKINRVSLFLWLNLILLALSTNSPRMSRIEPKYCSISTSYLARLFDILMLLHV